MNTNVDKEKDIAWSFIIQTGRESELWELSVAVHKIMRSEEFWRAEVRRRQDTINKLRKNLRDK